MQKRRRWKCAARRPPYVVAAPCDCALCAEAEQLHRCALDHPDPETRRIAGLFLTMMRTVEQGHAGAIELENCFD